MTANDYNIVSQTDTMVVFEDGKNIKTWLLILGILFLLIGAILYYLLAKKHTITVTMNETDKGTDVQCSTNTTKAMQTANGFLQSLPRS